MAVDAILLLYENVATGLVVYPKVIARHLAEELPFMASENLLMAAVAAGGDRQQLHEVIRRHSQAAGAAVKQEGRPNDLLERLAADPAFAQVDVAAAIDPASFVGRAPEQVDEFLASVVEPISESLSRPCRRRPVAGVKLGLRLEARGLRAGGSTRKPQHRVQHPPDADVWRVQPRRARAILHQPEAQARVLVGTMLPGLNAAGGQHAQSATNRQHGVQVCRPSHTNPTRKRGPLRR